ncbi:MAG: DUF1501 domain-containing protein [Chloroflexi bacterium]|nr:DUF1501 domain-containing protein [Chloroflexota bacterium]
MLDIQSRSVTWNCEGVCRRDFIRVGALSMLGLTLADWFQWKAHGMAGDGQAKSVILLWMGGGPTQTDTFDPKPQAGEDYCGPLRRPLATNVPGVSIGELLPRLSKQADKYAIIRSMTHGNNSHETAAYIMQTGTMPSDLAYPSLGSVVAFKKGYEAGYKGNLPPFITLTNPLGRFSETGFLGTKYKSFATGGDPNAKDFRVGGLVPPRGVTEQRLQERRSLLQTVDTLAKATESDPRFQAMDEFQQKAYALILGDAKQAFDLSTEKDELKEKYGRNRFGQSCLLARRLVENGVPFITINDGGWDTHKDHFPAMQRKLPILDQGFGALLEDLAQRGLLASTIVVWYGEFGRTPKVATEPPWNGGRHHFGACFSAVVAGGGFKGGAVVGASDNRGEAVRERPAYPWDLSASMYKLLGIDPHGRLPHPQGCVAYVSPLASGTVQSGGLLTEIM